MAMGLGGSATANVMLKGDDREAEKAENIGAKEAGGAQELVTPVSAKKAREAPLVVRALHPEK